ncbi:MAG: hypothetical protein NTW74_16500 [Acidobacteria bacterium]|nr:hypothetical protein [Acidobacteriota bacterium]
MRGNGDEAEEWNLKDLILPFGIFHGLGGEHKPGSYVGNGSLRIDKKDPGTKCSRGQELRELSRKNVDVVRNQDPIFFGGEMQKLKMGEAFDPCFMRAEKINGIGSTLARCKQVVIEADVSKKA